MSRLTRAIGGAVFNVLGVVELVVDVYDWVKKKLKPKRTAQDMLDEQEEVIPLRRVVRPPPLKAKPGGGAPPRGPAR